MLTFCFNDEDEAKASILGYQKYLSQWWDFEVHVSEVQEIFPQFPSNLLDFLSPKIPLQNW